VIATNHSYKAMDMRRGSVSEERITVVRNGPELDRMWPVEPDQDLRQKAGTIIAYAGEMGVQDGGDHAVRALWHLVYDLGRTDVFCVMIGTGDARASWQALARQLDLDAYIWFTGWIPEADFIRYLSTADICVAPDPSNPFTDRSTMNKVMDYMALARPIVAFDLREHRVTAQEAALYVRPNDELAFAHALAQLMDDPDRRQAMGAYGRRQVEEALAWHHSLPHLLKVYSSLLSGPDGAQDCRRGACESTEIWPKDDKH
jgi:glycosyltransferase involved in cell wall biosynthesis